MYETIRTTTMMTRKMGITPPPTQSKMSGTVDHSLRDHCDDESVAGHARHPDGRPGRHVGRRRGAVFVGLAFLLDQHAAVASSGDADRYERGVTDEVVHREGLGRLGPLEDAEHPVREPHAGQAERRADKGRLPAVDVEYLG